MVKRRSHFMIGLFVLIGVAIGIAAVIWIGASEYFEKGSLYVTYFDESVQGLQVDSRVKYRGVEIGKVESIGVAPDRRLVEVLMKIDLKGEDVKNVVTQLRAAGITGIVFIELDRRIESSVVLTPPAGMETRYPVIASQTSQSKQLLMGVDQIINKIDAMDFRGIADQTKQTLRAAEDFLRGQKMTGIMTRVDAAVGSLDGLLRKIDGVLAQGRVESLMEEAGLGLQEIRLGLREARQGVEETRQGLKESREAIADARRFLALIQDEVKKLKAAESAERAQRLIEGLDRRTLEVTADVRRTTDEISQAVDSLKLLLDRLHDNPSDLIFSRPDREDSRAGEEGR